ncbi:thiosulfate oxidation carrier protein SoxY [Bradyrhizobium quebecense]|uniref:Thiosulfate oxidation carrier protein SoxY n=2 Tax=Bradyrhizobium quebecense TaxID=2748629 RepID=A0ACD3V389_9BRAD|nr:thiosulfate oxidation carrier protein SoxY [Bradyrhizobium quebecense]UGY00822.1 thiosulfate oxidation carrier protein SoxY [Bradyrhizobium quebecense]
MKYVSRREVLALATQLMAIAITGTPSRAHSAPADAAAEIAKFAAGVVPEVGKITIDLPEIAENGNAVPLAVDVDYPMTPESHVVEVLVVAEANPWPRVARFHFTPMSGRAMVATRIRLAGTQTIHVLAKTNRKRILMAQRRVKVTIGGCGG